MRYYSRLQASESLQNKLSCVLRTWACQVTKKPTSSTKREKKEKEKEKKKKRKGKWKERENSLHYVIWDNSTRNKYNAEKGRKKAKNEVCYIQHRCPHVSPRNFAVPLNIF